MENELYHHGILGMKWGIRRYQNLDGSLTAEGRKRYAAGDLKDKDDRYVFNSVRAAELNKERNIANEYRTIAGESRNLVSRSIKSKKFDTSEMTNEDLSAYINRANLEKQYNAIRNESIKSGKKDLMKTLETVGSLAIIAGSVLGVAATWKELRKNDGK